MSCVSGYEADCQFMGQDRVNAKMDLTDRTNTNTIREQTIDNGKWDSWLKPVGVGVGVVNMGMNIGMYGTKKKDLKAQTSYLNTQKKDLEAETLHRSNVRTHNKEVMK